MKFTYFKRAVWLQALALAVLGACSTAEVEPVTQQDAEIQQVAKDKDSKSGRLPAGVTVSVFGGGPIYKNRTVSIP